MTRHVAIVGAGALGSMFGARLMQAGFDVTLVARGAHGEAMRRGGLRVTGDTTAQVRPRVALPGEPVPAADIALITCKAHQTAELLRAHHATVAGARAVASAQNGLGLDELVVRAAGAARVAGVTTVNGCALVEPGTVHHAGMGETIVGPVEHGSAAAAGLIHDALDAAGLKPQLARSILPHRWRKTAVNAAINPLTAILRVPNGVLAEDPRLRAEMGAIAREVAAVARANGIAADPEDYAAAALAVATRTAKNRTSMLQDLERGRPTEIDAITGAVVRAAAAAGASAPRCALLTALVQAVEGRR